MEGSSLVACVSLQASVRFLALDIRAVLGVAEARLLHLRLGTVLIADRLGIIPVFSTTLPFGFQQKSWSFASLSLQHVATSLGSWVDSWLLRPRTPMGCFLAGDGSLSLVRIHVPHLLRINDSLFIEGIPPVLLGFATIWVLPDYPQTARFLTEREREFLSSRMSATAPNAKSKTWEPKQIRALFKMPIFWTLSFFWIAHPIGAFGLAYVLPTVIYELGEIYPALN